MYAAIFIMKGGEPFQPVTAKADRSNGYVKGNKGMADVQPKASEMVNNCSYWTVSYNKF